MEKGSLANFSWELPISEIKQQRQSNVLPLGSVTIGIFYHRALLFKVCTVMLYDVVTFMFICNWFLARDAIYTSRAYATMSVSVCL